MLRSLSGNGESTLICRALIISAVFCSNSCITADFNKADPTQRYMHPSELLQRIYRE